MICEHTAQIRIGELVKNLPDVVIILKEHVAIEKTRAGFGGSRNWFLCPYCERRCAILYLVPPEYRLACRLCHDGRYNCEHRSPKDRRLLKAFKTRERLGQRKDGIVPPFPDKPKWMRWHTYLRIRKEALKLENELWNDVAIEMKLWSNN